MALQVSTKYDHIDVGNGSDVVRHYLNDNDSAAEIEKVERELSQAVAPIKLSWTNGSITSAGVEEDSTTCIRSSYLYVGDLEEVIIDVESGYRVSWLTYTDAKVVSDVQDWTTEPEGISDTSEISYIRFMLKKTNTSATVNVSDATNLTVSVYSKIQKQFIDIAIELGTKANTDGSYSGMTVGSAEQLVSTVGIEDKVPYAFRTAGGSADIGDREEDTVVGGSVVWNQLVNSAWLKNASYKGVTVTASGHSQTISGTATGAEAFAIMSGYRAVNVGDKLLLMGSKPGVKIRLGQSTTVYDTGNGVIDVAISTTCGTLAMNFQANDAFDNVVITPQLFNLTKMFGSTIADYLYTLETATPGAGVAWFKKLFPKSYYAYNTGTLMHVQTSAHNMTGFNQWDGETESGYWDITTGEKKAGTNWKRCANPIPVFPNTSYYFKATIPASGSFGSLMFLDSEGKAISHMESTSSTINRVITTPAGCAFVVFYANKNWFDNPICLNLHWDGERDGEYEPYQLNSYPLDSSLVLRGVPKIDADNRLYYDGDTYNSDGTVTRRYGVVDLGTLAWTTINNTSKIASFSWPEIKHGTNATKINAITTSKYPIVAKNDAGSGSVPAVEGLGADNNGNFFLYFPNESFASASEFKAALSGKYIVYELATPTTESAEPYAATQVVNNFGTEEYVDAGDRDVAIPVGHITKYLADLRAKIESAPNSPDGDGDYIVRQVDGENVYVPAMLNNKADINGSYDNMTVGNAKQVASTVGIEDKVPYNFRTSGGNADIGDREEDTVVGGSVVWNQIVQNGNFETASGWNVVNGTFSVSDNVATLTATGESTQFYKNIATMANHIYILQVSVNHSESDKPITFQGINTSRVITSVAGVWTELVIMGNETNTSHEFNIRATVTAGNTIKYRNAMMIDLTQMFGSTIADYLYTIETATAGAGVAWFRKLFPKPYYAYNAGELMHVQTTAHEMTGFNQWDEEWESGSYDASGNPSVDPTRIRTKNPIRIIGGATYYMKSPTILGIRYYDANDNFIDEGYTKTVNDYTTVPPTNACYLRFSVVDRTTYNHDICINLRWDGERDGEYEPYKLTSYPLDSSLTLRGIPKLDSNNALYYDGDVYEADGTVTRRYGIVDLGTLNWTKSSNYDGYFYTTDVADIAYPNGNIGSNKINALTTRYKLASRADLIARTDKIICGDGTATNVTQIQIKDSAYTDAAAFKTTMSGVYLVYELAEPTTEEAEPFQTPQIVDDFGTEEYVDIRDVAIPVGHETKYQPNLRAKLEMVPDSPDGNGDYIVRQTNGQNEYVPLVIPAELPSNPSENGTYVLKATVSNGTTTLSWEVQA